MATGFGINTERMAVLVRAVKRRPGHLELITDNVGHIYRGYRRPQQLAREQRTRNQGNNHYQTPSGKEKLPQAF